MAKRATNTNPRRPAQARATKRPRPSAPPVRQLTRPQRFVRWVTTSTVALVLGLIVIIAILVAMFFRLTAPAPGPTVPPAALLASPSALVLAHPTASSDFPLA